MMGYTHAAIGAGSALAFATIYGNPSPELFVVATIAGTFGGVAIDIDTKDHMSNPKVTDAGRTRAAAIGLLGVGIILDLILHLGIIEAIIPRHYVAAGGLAALIIFLIIGHLTEHRTFSHSLTFLVITALGMYYIYPPTMNYYLIGGASHLLLDILNHPYKGHGIWLFYPIKKGKGIALKLCTAARTGNKVFYFIGILLFGSLTAFFIWLIDDLAKSIAPAVIAIYFAFALHFVRVKSEREQRHIMHIKGEI